MKALLLSLVVAVSLAMPAWAETPAPRASKATPIIDIVAVVPGADHAARLKTKPDNVDLKPNRVLSSSGSLELDRRLAAEGAEQARADAPKVLVGTGLGLDARWDSLNNWNGGNAGGRPLGVLEARLDDQNHQGGFLAFRLPAGFLGDVMVGGGNTRTSAATNATNTSGAPRGAPRRPCAGRNPPSTTRVAAGGPLWPCLTKITNRVDLRARGQLLLRRQPHPGRRVRQRVGHGAPLQLRLLATRAKSLSQSISPI